MEPDFRNYFSDLNFQYRNKAIQSKKITGIILENVYLRH